MPSDGGEMNFSEILDKISRRSLVCGTVGLGYVGLPLAVEKAGSDMCAYTGFR